MDYEIEIKDLPAQPVATIRTTTAPDRMAATFGEVLPEISAYLEREGVTPAGPSFGIFHEYGPDHVDIEAGFPVPRPVAGEGRIAGRELDAVTAAVTWHVGPYSSIGEAHRAIEAWVRDQGRDVVGPPWEVYWAGPQSGRGPAEFRTEVGYPVR